MEKKLKRLLAAMGLSMTMVASLASCSSNRGNVNIVKVENNRIPKNLEKLYSDGKTGVLVINPVDATQVSAYRTIDLIKDIIRDNHLSDVFVAYNCDNFMLNDDYERANVVIGYIIARGLEANGIPVGLFGDEKVISEYLSDCRYYLGDEFSFLYCIDNNGIFNGEANLEGDLINNSQYMVHNTFGFVDNVVYIVQPGDTLSGIANFYCTSVSVLSEWNGLEDSSKILVGQKIKIPSCYMNGINLCDRGQKGYLFIVDVSRYQGEVDWSQASQYVDGAIIQYRDFAAKDIDAQFYNNVTGCFQNGVPFGVYYYSRALNEEDALREADEVIACLSSLSYHLSFPVYIDVEDSKQSDLCKNGKSKSIFEDVVKKFLEAGYLVGTYCNRNQVGNEAYDDFVSLVGEENMWHPSSITYKDPIVVGEVNDSIYRIYNADGFVQVTECGWCPGIGNVDVNVINPYTFGYVWNKPFSHIK